VKTYLFYRNKDFDWEWVRRAAAAREASREKWRYQDRSFDPRIGLPWNEQALTEDLALDTLFNAMAQDDDYIFEASRKVILTGVENDRDTIRYRQDILQDCLSLPSVVRDLYAIAVQALEKQKKHYLSGFLSRYPDSVLRESIDLMEDLLESLKSLSGIADSHADKFKSEGWTNFFAMLKRDLDNEYLIAVEHHLDHLKQRNKSLLLSAQLGKANKGSGYMLHQPPSHRITWQEWLKSLFVDKAPEYGFTLDPRDVAGSQALGEIRDRGICDVAAALGQSAENVRSFFGMLRAELAFYVGCINLREQLELKGKPFCLPLPVAAGKKRLSFCGLYDICLTLSINQRVVGNDVNADDRNLIIITGLNSGGKSTFLRSIGLAQLMMQCGMFVPAEAFSSSLCDGLFTHYKREEDTGMESGKFDEELSRMSEIVEHVKRHSMILFNESFAATNEREGSEIARQVITALLEKEVKVICVTHLYELANGFYERGNDNSLFLRANREDDGTKTFKLAEGKPLTTSFGEDLYECIFVPNSQDQNSINQTK
jgi:DNA mismatch repair ATPase MutS